ncbi:MAG TPA: uroporphyrinogen-III synthase, partial [Kiloniellales bacterium]|nr:uroporphyrinogen-III synthase [Kiloniellales bacterium]
LDPARGPLLHGAGRDVAAGLKEKLIAHAFDFQRIVLYAAEPVAGFSTVCIEELDQGTFDAVLFFSPRTAAVFAALISRAALQQACRSMTAYCLSDAVADAVAHLPWKALHSAAAPNQDALLALL